MCDLQAAYHYRIVSFRFNIEKIHLLYLRVRAAKINCAYLRQNQVLHSQGSQHQQGECYPCRLHRASASVNGKKPVDSDG